MTTPSGTSHSQRCLTGAPPRDVEVGDPRRVEREVGASQSDACDEDEDEDPADDRVPAQVGDERLRPRPEDRVTGGEESTEEDEPHRRDGDGAQHRPQERHAARRGQGAPEQGQATQPGKDPRHGRQRDAHKRAGPGDGGGEQQGRDHRREDDDPLGRADHGHRHEPDPHGHTGEGPQVPLLAGSREDEGCRQDCHETDGEANSPLGQGDRCEEAQQQCPDEQLGLRAQPGLRPELPEEGVGQGRRAGPGDDAVLGGIGRRAAGAPRRWGRSCRHGDLRGRSGVCAGVQWQHCAQLRAAFARRGGKDMDRATVQFADPGGDGQAETCAAAGVITGAEAPEDVVGLVCWDAGTVIGDLERPAVIIENRCHQADFTIWQGCAGRRCRGGWRRAAPGAQDRP